VAYVPGGSSPAVGLAIKQAGARLAAKPPAPKPPAAPRPSAGQLQQQAINKAVNALGIPPSDAQIQQTASNYLNPLVQALIQSTQQQSEAGLGQIRGYTDSLVQALQPFAANEGRIYGNAEAAQAASDAALSQRLSGGGADQAQQLASRLGSINAPAATAQAVQGATNAGVGAGNALYGHGSASLAQLIASGAASQDYAAKLPGIAGLSGLQQAGRFEGQLESDQAKSLSDIQSQIPGLVQNLTSQRQTLLNNRENLRQSIQTNLSNAAAKKQALAQEAAALAGKNAAPDATLSRAYGYQVDALGRPIGGKITPLPGYTVNGAGTGVTKTAKPTKPPAAPKAHYYKGSDQREYVIDPKTGKSSLVPGQNPPKSSSPTKESATQQRWDAEAFGNARIHHQPFKDKSGNWQPPLRWSQYVTIGSANGIPVETLRRIGRQVYTAAEIRTDSLPHYPKGHGLPGYSG
jgi:hypothetical protein